MNSMTLVLNVLQAVFSASCCNGKSTIVRPVYQTPAVAKTETIVQRADDTTTGYTNGRQERLLNRHSDLHNLKTKKAPVDRYVYVRSFAISSSLLILPTLPVEPMRSVRVLLLKAYVCPACLSFRLLSCVKVQ